ncbi:MAG: hypothetical protein PHD26_03965 [Methanosarcinaceae archaeon]|nr:hypothetical protein [Methanosarcinaceae archaeon]MDD4749085.1 hypothetical protein [Methanosarcinaceae archaeon]
MKTNMAALNEKQSKALIPGNSFAGLRSLVEFEEKKLQKNLFCTYN